MQLKSLSYDTCSDEPAKPTTSLSGIEVFRLAL